MTRSRWRKGFARLLLGAIAWLIVWTLGQPIYVDAAALLAIGLAAVLSRPKQLGLLLVSLILTAFGCEAVTRTFLATQRIVRDYREHERWVLDTGERSGNGRYVVYVNDRIEAPHGNLAPLDRSAPASIREPRVIVFKTDGLGHRNDSDYHGQQLVLSGDSFVVCSGTSQEDSLASVLRQEHGIDAYSIGHPGDPSLYVSMMQTFVRDINGSVRFLVFIFEGNDFTADSPVRASPEPGPYDRLKIRFGRRVDPYLLTPQVFFNLSRQAERRLLGRPGLVEVHAIAGKDVGFFGPYIDMACAPSLRLLGAEIPEPVRSRIGAVFFIPTKYRVYSPLLAQTDRHGRVIPTPPPGFVVLREIFGPSGIPVVDLTPVLSARARELAGEEKFVFWRDDTHWNGAGIRTAAAEIAAIVRSSGLSGSDDPSASRPR